MDQKNVVAAISLSAAVIILYSLFFAPEPQPRNQNLAEKNKILKDLKNIQETGVFAIVLEAVKNEVAKEIMKLSKVPIIGIGASKKCDGQILVMEDMLGMFKKVPKFVKKYSNLRGYVKKAVKEYAKDIKNKKFPTKKNIY